MPPEVYHTSSYRAATGLFVSRVHSLIWVVLLPAAAECVASVWFPSISLRGLDLQLAVLNVSGALFEGFFTAWEHGAAVANGPIGDMLSFIADDMRGSFLSTYTSWAGMVGFAAALTHSHGALLPGLAYMLCCVQLGFVAHAIGYTTATFIFGAKRPAGKASQRPAFDTSLLHHALIAALIAFIGATYTLVRTDIAEYNDSDLRGDNTSQLPALFAFLDAEHNRLVVGMLCSISGAYVGNALGNAVDGSDAITKPLAKWDLAAGTLVCNTVFAIFGVSLNAATLRYAPLQRSVLLQSFSGSFCGAASAFAGHASDASSLYVRCGALRAARNTLANIALSLMVFFLALEIERMLATVDTIDRNRDGIVQAGEVLQYYGLSSEPPPLCTGKRCR